MFKSDKKVHGLGAACTIACSDYSPGILDVLHICLDTTPETRLYIIALRELHSYTL